MKTEMWYAIGSYRTNRDSVVKVVELLAKAIASKAWSRARAQFRIQTSSDGYSHEIEATLNDESLQPETLKELANLFWHAVLKLRR
jgi:hypothetical protein